MVKTEAQDKLEPKGSQVTLAPTVNPALQDLPANVTPPSVPTTPALRTDLTPKMSRGLNFQKKKKKDDTKSLKYSCIYEHCSV